MKLEYYTDEEGDVFVFKPGETLGYRVRGIKMYPPRTPLHATPSLGGVVFSREACNKLQITHAEARVLAPHIEEEDVYAPAGVVELKANT